MPSINRRDARSAKTIRGDQAPPIARRPWRHGGSLLIFLVVASVLPVRPALAEPETASVTPERAMFQQEKALAHMKELEERMFRLAEMIRDEQPEDSARLLLGVRQARDELLTERMRQVAALVGSLELRDATREQQQIIRELEDLRTLLLTADLDLELKLEQLRKMREAIEQLDALIEKEQAQLDQTRPLAEMEQPPARPLLDALQDDEQRNAQAADDLKEQVGKLDGEAGQQAGKVGEAGQAMQGAAGQLGEGEAGAAAGKQGEAIEKLRDARGKIQDAREKLQNEIEMTVRKRVMEDLEEMLTRQTQVREATESLSDKAAAQDAQALLAVRRLAEAEDKIHQLCAETIALATETGFSVTLPPTLEAIRGLMIVVSDDLRLGMAGAGVIDRQQNIEAHLKTLIDAMEASNANADPQDNPFNQPPDVNQKRQELNKLLAEVRMLKILQLAVNQGTVQLEQDRTQRDLSTGQVRARAARLKRQQDAVRETTRKLDEMAKKQQQAGGM
jgi:hypothetical protein